MKTFLACIFLAAHALDAAAQSMNPLPQRYVAEARSGFRLGPRYSNYSTVVDIDLLTVESGRQHAIGLVGEYRSGMFVLDFQYDHDPENGIDLSDLLPIEFGNYSRERAEFALGWAAAPVLDLQGGVRFDTFSIGAQAFGGEFFDAEDFDHSALLVGVHVHTPTDRPFGVYGLFRAYVGAIDFEGSTGRSQEDATSTRMEGGIEIPIGTSNWRAVPGIEVERIDASPRLTVDTNRFFVNFVYRFR